MQTKGVLKPVASLPARGAWIETKAGALTIPISRRSPHGGRGLKHGLAANYHWSEASLPARGAWIETHLEVYLRVRLSRSLPARGAWIETPHKPCLQILDFVAPRTGGVD